MISIAPTLAGMASYPFVRLEEARRRLVAQGVDVIDFGKGDPNEPTDPMIRQALIDALPERSPYPLAQGLPELRAAVANWCARRFGVDARSRHGDHPDVRVEGGDLLARAGARRSPFREALRRVLRARVPGVRARRALRRRRGAHAAAAPRERLPAGSRLGRRRHLATDRDRLGELSEQPDRCARTARVLRAARRACRAIRLRDRLRRGVHRALVRRAAGVCAAGRRPLTRDRLPDPEQALVDDGLSLGLRRRARRR